MARERDFRQEFTIARSKATQTTAVGKGKGRSQLRPLRIKGKGNGVFGTKFRLDAAALQRVQKKTLTTHQREQRAIETDCNRALRQQLRRNRCPRQTRRKWRLKRRCCETTG